MSLYRWIWTRIGKRPWTFIYRDIWHNYEWFPQMQWLITGTIAYMLGGWKGIIIFTSIYTYGYINGHFFWGTRWRQGQKGNNN